MHQIGFDINLGLPPDFVDVMQCDISAFSDLDKMLTAFTTGHLSAIFTPVGALPYLTTPYQVLAQARLSSDHSVRLKSIFTSLDESTLAHIGHRKIGRVNKYCTTSFWAPLIYLMKQLLQNKKLTFTDTTSFEAMLNKAATGEVDYAMIWSLVLKKYPDSAKLLKQLVQYNDLPAPIIIGKETIPQDLINRLQKFSSSASDLYFNGFTQPDLLFIEKFKQNMHKAALFFNFKVI